MTTNDLKAYIKMCMYKKNTKQYELARKMKMSPQMLSLKFNQKSMKFDDIEKIANALNANVVIQFIDKENNSPIL